MQRRGRPENPRVTELGRYIQGLRLELGWSLLDLAKASQVPHRVVSKLELSNRPTTKANHLIKIADALNIHPDRLLIRAALTPLLRPTRVPTGEREAKESFRHLVTPHEHELLDNYLDYMRLIASLGS